MKHSTLYRTAGEFVLLCVCVFLFLSIISFDMGDSPSEFVWPHNADTANWCGPVGAFCAYHCLAYFGPGILLAWISGTVALVILLWGKPITQPLLRLIGLILVVAAVSTTWYLIWPFERFALYKTGSFPSGNGGVLGVATARFLKMHLATLGAWLSYCAAGQLGRSC